MIAAKMILIWLNRVGRFKIIGEKFDLRRILPLNSLHTPDLNHEKYLVAISYSIAPQLLLEYIFTAAF